MEQKARKSQFLVFLEGLFHTFDEDQSGELGPEEVHNVINFLESPDTQACKRARWRE